MTDLPARADVVIVGAGFAGCATAWALARRGVRALVLEREPVLGRYASGRGAGLGRQLAEDDATSALAIRGAAILRERFADAWSPTGGILGFDDPAALEAYAARARRLGVAHEVIDRARVLALWPALAELALVGAIHVPSDGVIDVRRLLARYADGLDIAFGVRVDRIADARIDTSRGTIAAATVVDASGAWAGTLVGDPPLDVFKRHLFVVEATPAPRAGTPFLWHLGRDELYVRPDAGGVLISSCDRAVTAAADQQPDAAGDHHLHARLRAAAPAWRDLRILDRRACQRAFAPDRLMRLGRDPARSWLVWAAALGGHGATASAAIGETVAALV